MPSPTDPTKLLATEGALDVSGAVPRALAGRLVGVGGDGSVHSFEFVRGRVSHLVRSARAGASVKELVALEGSVLVYSGDASVHQLDADLGTLRRVDLAGRQRTATTCPRLDPASGELHLAARDRDGTQTHVVVPPGALTRRHRPIAEGVAGVAPRDGEVRTTWIRTDVTAPQPVHTHRVGDAVILVVLTPSLERWILHPDGRAVEREEVDPTPRCFAHGGDAIDAGPGFVWTTGGGTIGRHDLIELGSTHLDLAPRAPRDFVVVPDTARVGSVDAGWFVGFVHHESGRDTNLWVIDAADPAQPAIATIPIPRPIPQGLRCAWIPTTQR